MMERNELGYEDRIRSLEQVLFKTSQSDRNRLFDHIYEKIGSQNSTMLVEIQRIDKELHRYEKRADHNKLEFETVREQMTITKNMIRTTDEGVIRQ